MYNINLKISHKTGNNNMKSIILYNILKI